MVRVGEYKKIHFVKIGQLSIPDPLMQSMIHNRDRLTRCRILQMNTVREILRVTAKIHKLIGGKIDYPVLLQFARQDNAGIICKRFTFLGED
jgi:hypothetical protein